MKIISKSMRGAFLSKKEFPPGAKLPRPHTTLYMA